MNARASFQFGLVKSTIASSRPKTQWALRCAGVHSSRSQAASSGSNGVTSRTTAFSKYKSGTRFSASKSAMDTV